MTRLAPSAAKANPNHPLLNPNRAKNSASRAAQKISGTASNFSIVNGFGNVKGDDAESYFVHQKEIKQNLTDRGFRALLDGARVSFIPFRDRQGRLQATEVDIIDWQPLTLLPEEETGIWMINNGVIEIEIISPDGLMVTRNVTPTLRLDKAAFFNTDGQFKSVCFALPEDENVVSLGLDAKKSIVPSSAVPIGGYVLSVVRTEGNLEVTINRYGHRYDNVGVGKNMVVVELRLALTLKVGADAAAIASAIDAAYAGDHLLKYHHDFVSPIIEAISRMN